MVLPGHICYALTNVRSGNQTPSHPVPKPLPSQKRRKEEKKEKGKKKKTRNKTPLTSSIRKAVRQAAPQARVLLAVGVDDGGGDVADGSGERRGLGHLGGVAGRGALAHAVPVDGAPGPRVREREVVRPHAHHGAVLLVSALGAD